MTLLPARDPHGYIAGATAVFRLFTPSPRLRFAYQARSIRAGIEVARRREAEPHGWIDWDLFHRAYLRTRIMNGRARRGRLLPPS